MLIPCEKIQKGRNLIENMLNKNSGKVTVHDLEKLTGFLNFLGRAIIPGRAFTCRLYAYAQGNLKLQYHVRINNEMRQDLNMWLEFLHHPTVYSRPFIDFYKHISVTEVNMYSDSFANPEVLVPGVKTHGCIGSGTLISLENTSQALSTSNCLHS